MSAYSSPGQYEQLNKFVSDIYHNVVERECPMQRAAQLAVNALAGTTATRLLKKAIPQQKLDFMTTVALKYVRENRPIPVLTAMGAKTPPFQVDFSEMFAMMVLVDLQNRVRQHYAPGLDIVLRLEDLTMMHVIPGADEAMLAHFSEYAKRLKEVVRALDADSFITISQETAMMNRETHTELVQTFSPLFTEYMVNDELRGVGTEDEQRAKSAEALATLQREGWKGDVTPDQREYLRRCYRRRYPTVGVAGHDTLVSNYFANTLVRRQLRGVGDRLSWTLGRMELSFCEPLPDSEQFERTRVHYRSNLHSSSMNTRRTVPFWRNASVTCHRGTRLTMLEIEFEEERLKRAPVIQVPVGDTLSLPVIVVAEAETHECRATFG